MINTKKIITILIFLLLLSCGYEPIYSKKKIDQKYNFSISKIDYMSKNRTNKIITNNLKNYINLKKKPKEFNLLVDTKIIKNITSKDKQGNAETFVLKINVNLKTFEGEVKKDEKNFVENFEYKNQSNKFNLEQYEKNIQEILINKISKNIISYLYYIK